MAEIWPNLLPRKTFRTAAYLCQRLDSGHFLLEREEREGLDAADEP